MLVDLLLRKRRMLMVQRYRHTLICILYLHQRLLSRVICWSEGRFVSRVLIALHDRLELARLGFQVTTHLRVHLSLVISSLPLIEVLLVLLH
jgi:hypothetical protein